MRLPRVGTRWILLTLAAALCLPSDARAHARLVRSEPAAGSTLAVSPQRIRLVFSEEPVLAMTSVRILDSAGDIIRLAGLRIDPADAHAILADVPRVLEAGTYRIAWTVAARDGHPRKEEIRFTVATAASEAQAAGSKVVVEDRADSSREPAAMRHDAAAEPMGVSGAVGAIGARWLSFVSIFVLIGVVVFRFGVLRRLGLGDADAFMQIASGNAAALGIASASGVLLSTALKIARESADMPDMPLGGMLFGSLWGWAILAQVVAAVAAAVAFRGAQTGREKSRRHAWTVALVTAVVLAITPSLGGHAVGSDHVVFAIPADVMHVVAGSGWLGTLAVIVLAGIPAALKAPDTTRPGARIAGVINVFSPLALTCGGIVVATGVASSLVQLPRLNALWTTSYGLALVLKLLFVAMLFGAGAWNWRRMKPRLTGDDAVGPMRGMASLELLLAAVVLVMTAILVALALPE